MRHGKASERLHVAVAASTRLHANQVVPWDDIRALLTRRGIALDKRPGIRPIGIGKVRQCIRGRRRGLRGLGGRRRRLFGLSVADGLGPVV